MEAGGLGDGYVAVGVRLVEGDEVPGLEVEELDEGRGGGPLVGAPREGAEREGVAVGEMVAEERRDLDGVGVPLAVVGRRDDAGRGLVGVGLDGSVTRQLSSENLTNVYRSQSAKLRVSICRWRYGSERWTSRNATAKDETVRSNFKNQGIGKL